MTSAGEALRGPQGTLYGARHYGLILDPHAHPDLGDFGGDANAEFGNYGRRR